MTTSNHASTLSSASAGTAATTELDPQQIAMLRGLRKGSLLPVLLRTYRDQLPPQLSSMATAATAGDLATLGAVAHSLKSASYSIGANRMGDLCTAIEAGARQGDPAAGPRQCAALSDAWARLRPELEGYLVS